MKVVLDTNILVSALMSRENACRKILYMAFDGEITPLVSNTLFLEYEDVMTRDHVFERCPFDREQRDMFLDDVLSQCRWVDIRYLWQPNLRDEADNHVMELAIAGQGEGIVTQNIKDFRRGEVLAPQIGIWHPFDFLKARDIHKKRSGQWQH